MMELCLPVSKADTEGKGTKRRLRCTCGGRAPMNCAACALLLLTLEREEEEKVDHTSPEAWDVHLVVLKDGGTPAKRQVVGDW